MKKNIFFTFLFMVTSFVSINAKVLTVNNGTVGAGQYTKIQDAVDAASVGDTIYVHGSQTRYGDVTLNKRLVLLGAGYNVKGTQYNFPTTINYIYLSRGNSTTIPTGSIIKGFFGYGLYGTSGNLKVDNIILERNRIDYIDVYGTGWIVRNNIINGIDVNDNKNLIISNNIIRSNVSDSNKPSIIISNNICLQGFSMSGVHYSTFTNNILLKPSFNSFSGTQNTYNKNVVIYADPANYVDLPLPNNTGVGNLNTIEVQFTETIPLNVSLANSLNYEWKLLETSLGTKYGTDGTDIGIYGGSYQMPNLTGATSIPQMVSMDLQNSVIPQNGKLVIEFKARGQQ